MAAVAPLEDYGRSRRDPDWGLRVRERDLKRAPLARRPIVRANMADHVRSHTTSSIPRPHLEVVAPVRRRRGAMALIFLCGLLLFAMLVGTVAFQTQIARNQLALDKVEKEVAAARDRYDVLRRQRAELRSPNRLAVEATRLGMAPAGSSEFMPITPDVAAAVAAAASGLPDDIADSNETSLDQFAEVKAVTGDIP
jgi:hypothetical protein